MIDLTDTVTLNDVTDATTYYFNYTPTENSWYTFHATIPGSWDIKNHNISSDYGHSTYLVDHIGSEDTVAYLEQGITYSFEYVPEEAGTTTISVSPANQLEHITAGTTYSLSVLLDSYRTARSQRLRAAFLSGVDFAKEPGDNGRQGHPKQHSAVAYP